MSKTIEEILEPKPEARPRIYAYSIADDAHKGLLKVGQTTRDVKQRVAEQLKTAAIRNYKIELDESAERDVGTIFSDHDVRAVLVRKGFENADLEWMRCTVKDLKAVLTELRTGQRFTGTHHETFTMRAEQRAAVDKTHAYFHSIWKEDMHAVPRFASPSARTAIVHDISQRGPHASVAEQGRADSTRRSRRRSDFRKTSSRRTASPIRSHLIYDRDSSKAQME